MGAKTVGSLAGIAAGLLLAAVALPQENLVSGECLIGATGACGQYLVGVADGGIGGATCNRSLLSAQLPTVTSATDDYMNVLDHTKSSVESTVLDFLVPVDMVAHDLYVYVDTAPGSGDAWRMTLRDDQANTLLTCDISDLETECFDEVNAPEIAAGSFLTMLLDSSIGATDPTFGSFTWTLCLDEA